MSFNGKVCVVTNSTSRIGSDVARHLASLGAKVSIVGRNEKRLKKLADQIIKARCSIPLSIVADVTKDAERIVDETIKHFGQLDVLINNAGIAIQDSVTEANMSEFDHIFNTCVKSIITLTKLCVPHLEKTCGNVVNISSMAGFKPISNFMTYCMTKAALDQFTKCAALDFAYRGIRINSVNPAAIQTPIFETFGLNEEQVERMVDVYKQRYPIGRMGEIYDTSAAVAYLADDKESSYLNGILLPVN